MPAYLIIFDAIHSNICAVTLDNGTIVSPYKKIKEPVDNTRISEDLLHEIPFKHASCQEYNTAPTKKNWMFWSPNYRVRVLRGGQWTDSKIRLNNRKFTVQNDERYFINYYSKNSNRYDYMASRVYSEYVLNPYFIKDRLKFAAKLRKIITRSQMIEQRAEPVVRRAGLEACPICQEIQSRRRRQSLHCGHEFHHRCIQRWFERSRTCPVCRANV